MQALILLSHGSRRPSSNAEMIQLAESLARDCAPFDRVTCAFQQFATPAFEHAVEALVEDGISAIVVYPLFLAAGSHVLEDVPALIDQARRKFPNVIFTTMPHLGQTPTLAQFLMSQARTYV